MSLNNLQSNRLLRLLKGVIMVFALLVVLVGSLAFFLLDTLALWIARPALASYGITLQQVAGLQLDLHRIRLQRVDFLLNGASQTSQIAQLEVQFSASGLFAMPLQLLHVEHISLALADSVYTESRGSSSGFPQPPRLDEILAVLQAIPADAVEIERLDVAPYITAGLLNVRRNDHELQVQIDAQETQLALTVDWQGSVANPGTTGQSGLVPGIAAPPRLITGQLDVAALGSPLLSTEFSLSELDSLLQLDADSIIQLQALSAFAQHAGLLPEAIVALDGTLSAKWHLYEETLSDLERGVSLSFSINPNSRLVTRYNPALAGELNQSVLQNSEAIDVRGTYTFGTEDLTLHLQAPATTLSLNLGQAEPAQLGLAVDSLEIDCNINLVCSMTQATRVELPELTWLDTHLEDLLLISNGDISLSQDRFTVQFAQGSRLELGVAESAFGQLTQVNLLVQQVLDIAFDVDEGLELTSQGFDLYLPNILIDGKNSHVVGAISDLSFRRRGQEMQLQAHTQLRNLGSDWLPFILRKPELDLDVDNRNNSLALTGQLRVADRDLLHFESTLDMQSQVGKLTVDTPVLNFSSGSQSLSHLFFQAPFEADLVAGSAQASAELTITTDNNAQWLFNGPLNLTLNTLSGFVQETAFIGLNTQVSGQLQDSKNFKSNTPHSFSLASVDPGLAIEDIAFLYDIDTQASLLKVENFEAHMFRGRAHFDSLNFDWSAPSNHVNLQLERIDLSSMLSMAAYDNVEATGLISGTLPISLAGTTPSVGAGSLQVEAPGGAIRYSPSSGANSGNATLDFVNQALSDYQYNLMETDVEYLPTGELQLGVRLQGRNPDLNNGQRINLNLNISDNIPALLRSLQSGRSIADALERELQAR